MGAACGRASIIISPRPDSAAAFLPQDPVSYPHSHHATAWPAPPDTVVPADTHAHAPSDPHGSPWHPTLVSLQAVPPATVASSPGKLRPASPRIICGSGSNSSSPVTQATVKKHAAVQTDDELQLPAGPTMPVEWRKGAPVGSGSFGTVFLALNTNTGELLAVKEVSLVAEGSKGREAVEQLEQEIALLSSLSHPHIVKYVGTVREGNMLLIFLEYVPGGSIASLLARFGALPEPLVRLLTRQLLEGLAYLHAQRTAHRDIKGANLLLETSGRVKLADFGMAKQMVEAASFTQSFKGSAFWMAPEVIRQQGHGVAADIWSVGCTVIELATGRPPWPNCTTQVQVIFKIASSSELPAVPEGLSPLASEFILLCLQRDPHRRPSAAALLEHPWVRFDDEWQIPALAGTRAAVGGAMQGPGSSLGAVMGLPLPGCAQLSAPRYGYGGMPQPAPAVRRMMAEDSLGRTRHVLPLQSGIAQMSEAELDAALTSLVLGSAAHGRAVRQGGQSGSGTPHRQSRLGVRSETGTRAAQPTGAMAPGSAASSDGPGEEVEWDSQPATYRVTGLLTLPPLTLLGAGTLPSLQLS